MFPVKIKRVNEGASLPCPLVNSVACWCRNESGRAINFYLSAEHKVVFPSLFLRSSRLPPHIWPARTSTMSVTSCRISVSYSSDVRGGWDRQWLQTIVFPSVITYHTPASTYLRTYMTTLLSQFTTPPRLTANQSYLYTQYGSPFKRNTREDSFKLNLVSVRNIICGSSHLRIILKWKQNWGRWRRDGTLREGVPKTVAYVP